MTNVIIGRFTMHDINFVVEKKIKKNKIRRVEIQKYFDDILGQSFICGHVARLPPGNDRNRAKFYLRPFGHEVKT